LFTQNKAASLSGLGSLKLHSSPVKGQDLAAGNAQPNASMSHLSVSTAAGAIHASNLGWFTMSESGFGKLETTSHLTSTHLNDL